MNYWRCDNVILLPTLSGEFKKGVIGATEYFEYFLAKKPFGKIIESEVQKSVDEKAIIYFEMYNFAVGPDESREVVQARFTFVF